MFSPISADQLECPAQQPLGVSETLLGLGNRGAEILAAGWNSQRADLGELLTIPLYVFGYDRQSGGDWVVHGLIVAGDLGQSSLPRMWRCRYRGHLCIW